MNETARIITCMKRNPLFSALPGQAIDHLASHACLQRFDSGQILIEENGDNSALFLLTKGTVSIIINATEVGTQQAGETVGEISMSKISPPVARVMATEGVEAASFPFEIIDACCADHPDFAMRLRATGLQKVYGR